MACGSKKAAKDIKVGDKVMTAAGTVETVVRVVTSNRKERKNMVKLGDFWITRGHPIFVRGV